MGGKRGGCLGGGKTRTREGLMTKCVLRGILGQQENTQPFPRPPKRRPARVRFILEPIPFSATLQKNRGERRTKKKKMYQAFFFVAVAILWVRPAAGLDAERRSHAGCLPHHTTSGGRPSRGSAGHGPHIPKQDVDYCSFSLPEYLVSKKNSPASSDVRLSVKHFASSGRFCPFFFFCRGYPSAHMSKDDGGGEFRNELAF